MQDAFQYLTANYTEWLYYLAITSIIFLFLSLLFIPFLVTRIPVDYFNSPRRIGKARTLTWRKISLLIGRTIIGTLLLLAGIIMLVLPGQGLLTILAGILILEFPGKYRLERYLVKKPAILNSVNWIRRRQNVPEIHIVKK